LIHINDRRLIQAQHILSAGRSCLREESVMSFEPLMHGPALIFMGMMASFALVLLGCSISDALKP
jgi:hypothetical protein